MLAAHHPLGSGMFGGATLGGGPGLVRGVVVDLADGQPGQAHRRCGLRGRRGRGVVDVVPRRSAPAGQPPRLRHGGFLRGAR